MMDRQCYLRTFSRQVRWRVPKPEADDILSDYEEILRHHRGTQGDTWEQELGSPQRAARMVTEPKAYRCWLSVFSALLLCLLLPEMLLLQRRFVLRPWCWLPCFLMIGSVVSLRWFRRGDSEKPPMPKGIFKGLAVELLGFLAGGVVLFGLALKLWGWLPANLYGTAARLTLTAVGSLGAIAAAGGAIQARLSDRRWQAVYIMGLTVLIACTVMMSLLTSMEPFSPNSNEWWLPYGISCGIAVGWGVTGTGIALC